jgi:hypothetical protein
MKRKSDYGKTDAGRLTAAMKRGRQALEVFRKNRRNMVRQYVGANWSEDGTTEQVPLNLLALFVEIVSRNLVAKNPRVLLTTHNAAARRTVDVMGQWMNDELENGDVAQTLHRVVVDALFSIGIAKVALATPADVALAGYSTDAGAPFVERVDLDDFVFDVYCRDFSEAGFLGHRYRVPRDAAESFFHATIEPTETRDYNAEGDERIAVLGRGQQGEREEYEDHVDLWEVYCPRKRSVKTFRSDEWGEPQVEKDGGPLHEQPWVGPDCGPYHFLCFGVVPGNAMPKAPIQDLFDLHLAVNLIYRKSIRQARDQKRVTLLAGSLTDAEQETIVTMPDGGAARISNLQGVMTVDMNGPNAPNAQFGLHLNDLFSRQAGNLDMLGGLAPQAKTAKQDAMLNANSSQKMASMLETTQTFVSAVAKAMGWYHWRDPFRTRTASEHPPGVPEAAITRAVTPQDRMRVAWDDVRFRVDPYSYRFKSPEQRAGDLKGVMTELVLPMAQMLQQQGEGPDLAHFLKKMAEYLDIPDLPDVVKAVLPPEPAQGGGGESHDRAMPLNTEREYTRRSIGGDSPQARAEEFGAAMQAAGEQTSGGMMG